MSTENTSIDQNNIDIIKRQTDYNENVIREKLALFNNNITDVIRDYMNPPKTNEIQTTPQKKCSKNQQIYKEIRCMMDDASMLYEEKKEKEKKD